MARWRGRRPRCEDGNDEQTRGQRQARAPAVHQCVGEHVLCRDLVHAVRRIRVGQDGHLPLGGSGGGGRWRCCCKRREVWRRRRCCGRLAAVGRGCSPAVPAVTAIESRFSSDGPRAGAVEAPRNQPVDVPVVGKQFVGNLQRNPHIAAAGNLLDHASDFVHGDELWVGRCQCPRAGGAVGTSESSLKVLSSSSVESIDGAIGSVLW